MKIGTTTELDLFGFVTGLFSGKKPEEKKKDTPIHAEEKEDKDANDDENNQPIVLKR